MMNARTMVRKSRIFPCLQHVDAVIKHRPLLISSACNDLCLHPLKVLNFERLMSFESHRSFKTNSQPHAINHPSSFLATLDIEIKQPHEPLNQP